MALMAGMEFRIREARPEARARLFEGVSQLRTSSVIADRKMAVPIFTASTVAGVLMATFASSSWIDAPKACMRPIEVEIVLRVVAHADPDGMALGLEPGPGGEDVLPGVRS